MSFTKKMRFEVFKRDFFSCQYCGRKPPEITLEIDHIIPKSRGGNDLITNLISACFDCNRGKGATSLKQIKTVNISTFTEEKEKLLQLKEYNKFLIKQKKLLEKSAEKIGKYFLNYFVSDDEKNQFILIGNNASSVKKFLNYLPEQEILTSIDIAHEKMGYLGEKKCFLYFCGICWRKIKRNQGDCI